MKARRVAPMLSRDEKKLIYWFRQSHPFARGLLLDHAKDFAELERQRRGPVPANVLAFRTEAAGRAGSDR